jgi:hypothetical protein
VTNQKKIMLDVKDVMDMMGICKTKAYEVLKSEQFHVVKMGRKYMVHHEVFENWLKGEKTKKKSRW